MPVLTTAETTDTCTPCTHTDVQWRIQVFHKGDAEQGAWGTASGVQGQSPDGGLGAKPQKLETLC